MILIRPSHEIIETAGDEKLVERVARTCYKSESRITDDSANKFVKMLRDRGHHAMLEFGWVCVKFICDRGCCYDSQTEVLTQGGWKYFKDLIQEDKLACLNDSNYLEWHQPQTLQQYDFKGKMLSFQTPVIDLMVTPNHKMWVFDYDKCSSKTGMWKFLEAQDMTNGHYGISKTAHWHGEEKTVCIPEHPTRRLQFPALQFDHILTADLFELLGLWAINGSYRYSTGWRSSSSIQISLTELSVYQKIKSLCQNLGLRCTRHRNELHIDNLRLFQFVLELFGQGPRRVPDLIKEASAAQIRRFLDGVVAGDNSIQASNGHITIYTASKHFADGLQELYLKVGGLSANIKVEFPRESEILAGISTSPNQKIYLVSVHKRKRSIHRLDRRSAEAFREPVKYSGKVYCATVPFHRLYVRRNGKACWSGNSHELVRHRLVSFAQESTRYCNYRGGITFVIPPWLDLPEGEYNLDSEEVHCNNKLVPGLYKASHPAGRWFWHMIDSQSNYQALLTVQNWTPQQARSVLPNSLKTEIVCAGNLREWRHILQLRTSKAAHPQMQELMVPLLKDFQTRWPVLFEDIGEKL